MKIEDVRFKAKIKDIEELLIVTDLDCDCLTGNIINVCVYGKDDPVQNPFLDKEGYGCLEYPAEYVEPLLPYTGFKDKNGESIYEGDILEYPNGGIGLVEYEYGCPTVRKIGEKDIVDYIDCHRLFFVDDYSFEPHTKIIGNCFENHELLKKEVE